MADSVITPFMPPKTVKRPVNTINPIAPYQKGKPRRLFMKIPPVNAVTLTLVSTYAISVMIESHEPVRGVYLFFKKSGIVMIFPNLLFINW